MPCSTRETHIGRGTNVGLYGGTMHMNDFEAACMCPTIVEDCGSLGWSARCESRSMRHASTLRGERAAVHVRFDAIADVAGVPAQFFTTGCGGVGTGPGGDRRAEIALDEFGACVYASRDESVMGRCFNVTCAHRKEAEAGCNRLFAHATWNVTIIDDRLAARDLAAITDAIDRVHLQTHTLGLNGPPRRQPLSITHEIAIWDLADNSVRHAVNSVAAALPASPGKHPDLHNLFRGRAPGPTLALDRQPSAAGEVVGDKGTQAITFAGGNAAVAIVDSDTARSVLLAHAEDTDLDGIDEDGEGRAPGVMIDACNRAGIGRPSVRARVLILLAQTDRAPGRSETAAVVRRIRADRMAGCNPNDAAPDDAGVVCCLFVGTPAAFVATLAHHVYDTLVVSLVSGLLDWEAFEAIEMMAELAPDAHTVAANEALRARRARASRIIAKAVDARADAICAHLWRANGNLIRGVMDQYAEPRAGKTLGRV